MIPTVVIGGEKSFVQEKLAPNLALHNLDIVDIWPWDKEPGTIPDGTKLLFFLTDMMSHRHNDNAKAEALRRNIPIVYGVRKWSVTRDRLVEAGYEEVTHIEDMDTLETIRVSNPTMPGGYYEGVILAALVYDAHITVTLETTDGPQVGAVYTDVLVTRDAYENNNKAAFARIQAFRKSCAVPDTDNDESTLDGRTMYFHYYPGNTPPLTYVPKSTFDIKSARARKTRKDVSAPPTPVSPVPLVPPVEVPVIRADLVNEDTATSTPVMDPAAALVLLSYRGQPERQKNFMYVMKVLAENPTLTTKEIGVLYNKHHGTQISYKGILTVLARDARVVLGLSYDAGGNVYINRPLYEHTCKACGATPVAGDRFRRNGNLSGGTAVKVAKATEKAAPKAPPVAPVKPAPVAAAPVEVTPTVAPPAEPPAAMDAQKGELDDLKEILSMLREEMAKRDIRRLVVTPTGVDMTRVVVQETKLEF